MPKTVTDQQHLGELGEQLVKTKFMQLGHVYETHGRLETGIDGMVTFRDPQTGCMTGKMVAVQVKATGRRRYDDETEAEFTYLLRAADVTFWQQASLPVVLILYRRSDDSYFWKSVADCVPGQERRLRFEKSLDRLEASAIDRMAHLAVERGRLGAFVPPLRTGELAHLNLMRIVLPDKIFVAATAFASGRDAVPHLVRLDDRRFDWVIKERRFISFVDPRGICLETIVDVDTVEAVETELIADSDDPDDDLIMIELLRRTMVEQFAADFGFDSNQRAFYFRTSERFQPRRYDYRSLREATWATVVQVYQNRKYPDRIHNVRHHGFKPRFERIGSDWFLSISPTFVFTDDGFRPHRFASELLAGKKRRDRNGSIRGQVFMFRFFLAGATLNETMMDLFGHAATDEGPLPVLRFETIDPVEMEVAVPEDVWTRSDPNAERMKVENDDEPAQRTLGMTV